MTVNMRAGVRFTLAMARWRLTACGAFLEKGSNF